MTPTTEQQPNPDSSVALQLESHKDEWTKQIADMRAVGFEIPYVEAGPNTYSMLEFMVVASTPIENVEALKEKLARGMLVLTFAEVRVVCCEDVPDGRLWPPREISGVATHRKVDSDMQKGTGEPRDDSDRTYR